MRLGIIKSKPYNLHVLNIKPTNLAFQEHRIRPDKPNQRPKHKQTPIIFRSFPNIKTHSGNKPRNNKILTIILMYIKTIPTLKTMPSILEFSTTIFIQKTIIYFIMDKYYISWGKYLTYMTTFIITWTGV